ncbi:uncharacterized protein LOC111684597 [Lucilia cuprina]|uniref:uncharacterized protein LOC111684597 n=1 Tax=Lucilia cuprina TaxID=7375 RepID=UPI001F05BBF6|nr:uncharacterized protein LOC111684597 [Lucilia cuprina]
MIFSVVNVFVIYLITTIQAKPQYIVDVIDVEWNVTSNNNCDMAWQISQPTRGTFAVTGFLDFKEDINTDNAKGWVNIYYSSNAISYMLTPFRIPPTVFTDGVNFLYKNYLMDSVKECCENPIDFEDKFVQPLTKRRMICENCLLPSDNFPSHMRMGFYKMEGISAGEIAFAMTLTVKVERE